MVRAYTRRYSVKPITVRYREYEGAAGWSETGWVVIDNKTDSVVSTHVDRGVAVERRDRLEREAEAVADALALETLEIGGDSPEDLAFRRKYGFPLKPTRERL